jgi:hypothetical protein
MEAKLVDGARNCVVQCAKVHEKETVLLINQAGVADSAVSDALAQAAQEAGARVRAIWRGARGETAGAGEPLGPADVTIVTGRSTGDEAPEPTTGSSQAMVRSTNWAVTEELMASEWARFPYAVQEAILAKIDEVLSAGKSWRITTPSGTDLRGEFSQTESVIGGAFFRREGRRRGGAFPGANHYPFASMAATGVLMVEHARGFTGHQSAEAIGKPIRVEFRNNRISSIDGEDPAVEVLRQQIRERTEADLYVLDSWHAGANPKTVVPYVRTDEPRLWWNYAHHSPAALHFHLGTEAARFTLCCFAQTISVDGRTVYEDGELAVLNEIEHLAKRYPDALFVNNPLPI